MDLTISGAVLKVSVDTAIALLALIVSALALGLSVYFWRRQFRPIVTAAVRTASGGSEAIAYNLVILNSGAIPAKNITLKVDESTLQGAFGADATTENKARWLACFTARSQIKMLHNGARMCCSFGTTSAHDRGFWKVRSQIAITISYDGWFGRSYTQLQTLEVVDSASFTGYMWGDGDA